MSQVQQPSMQREDPWVVQAPKESTPLPPAFYIADYEGAADFTMNDGAVKWRWEWKVKSGPHTGKTASALTDRSISPATLAGRLIQGLLGRQLQVGENVKSALDACKGKTYMVSVEPGPRGGKPCVRQVGDVP